MVIRSLEMHLYITLQQEIGLKSFMHVRFSILGTINTAWQIVMGEKKPDSCHKFYPNYVPAFLDEEGIVTIRATGFVIRNREKGSLDFLIGDGVA